MSFAFSEHELLNSQITHARFLRLLHEPSTQVLAIKESTNSYGEFLFVTVAAYVPRIACAMPELVSRFTLTFWGLGFHDARECWLTDLWRWHEAQRVDDTASALNKTNCMKQIEARLKGCQAEAVQAPAPSSRAAAFAFFAELGDEDGALTELEDLEALGIDLEGLFDE
jgi:hypothetical protein